MGNMGQFCYDFLGIIGHGGCEDNYLVVARHDLQELLEEGTHKDLETLFLVLGVDKGLV